MTGYLPLKSSDNVALLGNDNVQTLTTKELNDHFETEVIDALEEGIPAINYYHVPDTNLTVITTPLPAHLYGEMISYLNQYFLDNDKDLASPRQFLMGLIGHGATENHIVTAYSSADRKTVKIFDPKVSDAPKFFAKERDKSLGTFLLSLFRAILPDPRQAITISDNSNPDHQSTFDAEYISLGTQSFFDPASCGYHSAATIKIGEDLLTANQPLTREAILAKTGNPVSEGYDQVKSKSPERVRISLLDFLKQAWQDTVMPLLNEEERKTTHFGHYFMGWPKEQGIGKKVVYFATLGFLTNPLVNMVRRPVELVINSLAAGFSFMNNQLINWAPTHAATQYLRSGLMLLTKGAEFLLKGIYFALGTVTSPIANFQAAQQIKDPIIRNVLSALTILTTVAAYSVLAIFAAPAVFPLVSSALPALAAVVNTLVIPYVAPATVAFLIPAVGGALVAGVKLLLSKLIDGPKKKEGIDDFDIMETSDSEFDSKFDPVVFVPGASNVKIPCSGHTPKKSDETTSNIKETPEVPHKKDPSLTQDSDSEITTGPGLNM